MDYEKISNKELCHLLKERKPDMEVPKVMEFNRQTVIAFLKVLAMEDEVVTAHRSQL
jgi:hypothetical protein